MKNLAAAFALLLNISALHSQNVYNDANAQSRKVSSFHAIQVSGAVEVVLSQGTEEGLAVSANKPEYVQHIRTEIENGVLKIGYDEKERWWPKMQNRKLRAYVSVKSLDEIKASGASDVHIDGQLAVPALVVKFSGASDLKGKLNVSGNLKIELGGASDVNMSGSANETTIEAHGASEVKAYDFNTINCSVRASGASSVNISVDKEISANISGASSVSYKGNATTRDIKSSGASSISRKS